MSRTKPRKPVDAVGAAEAEVGRYVYRRIEALMDAKPGTADAAELTYLAKLAESVEEYGEDACAGSALADFPTVKAEESGVYLEWRPIETVPRDGTSVLIYFAKKTGRLDGVYQVFWANIHGGETTPENGSWCVDDEKHGPYALRGWCVGDPTAWLPLPTPPKSEADHG